MITIAWSERGGQVSRSFDEWVLVESDIRGFMDLGLQFSRDAYSRIWKDIEQQSSGENPPDVPDAFHGKIGGVWPYDYEWMHLSAVLKDAVTAYEVYLDTAMEEILGRHGLTYRRPRQEWTLPWKKLKEFYEHHLGIDVCPEAVKQILDLRHLLTHRRGELRSEAERVRYGEILGRVPGFTVNLTEEDVRKHLDTLAATVRAVDEHVYRFSWGGQRLEGLVQERDDPDNPEG